MSRNYHPYSPTVAKPNHAASWLVGVIGDRELELTVLPA